MDALAPGRRDGPTVSVVIPHYAGDILTSCLRRLFERTQGPSFEVIVVDDRVVRDGSIERAEGEFPGIRVVRSAGGQGFGAACNRGIDSARGRFVVLLNDDTEVQRGWLPPLLAAARQHPRAAAFQPKVLSMREGRRFDYGGAAGGLMDILGYPFARGRVFGAIEDDHGQYDRPEEVFWALGGAVLFRREALERVGLFDESFYMHMEEIDLCWRLHLLGYRVRSVPESVVRHHGGFTLKTGSFKKTYLNHRNSLVTLLKNYTGATLLWLLPVRACFELLTIFYGVVRRDWKHPLAALLAIAWVALHPVSILRRRREVQIGRLVSDGPVMDQMYRGSIVYSHFIRGIQTAAEILCPTNARPLRRLAGAAAVPASQPRPVLSSGSKSAVPSSVVPIPAQLEPVPARAYRGAPAGRIGRELSRGSPAGAKTEGLVAVS